MHFKGISSPDADQSRVGEFGGWGMGLESLSSWAYAVYRSFLFALPLCHVHASTHRHRVARTDRHTAQTSAQAPTHIYLAIRVEVCK